MASRSSYRLWILAPLTALNVAACAAMSFGGEDGGNGGSGGNTWTSGGGGTGGIIDYDASTGGTGAADYAALCGRGTCDPSAHMALASCGMDGTGGTGGTGGAGASGGSGAGGGGAGGAGASSSSGSGGSSSGTGGAGAASGTGGATTGGAGGAGGSGVGGASTGGSGTGGSGTGGSGGAVYSAVECKLVLTSDEAGASVDRSCVPSGEAPEFAPCNTAADCGPGLGCVLSASQGSGVCRTYCCGDVEACGPHTFCAPRPMAEANDPAILIPVCDDADECTLLEANQCDEGLACAVVRADGTTACVAPGPGKQGESCPCAEGFACSKLVNECREICHTDPEATAQECDPGYYCQGNASLPDNFGLCISTSDL